MPTSSTPLASAIDDSGKFAKADLCKVAPAAGAYKLDAQGKCHDAKGKFAKAEMCKA